MSTTHGAQPGSSTSGDETQVHPRPGSDGGTRAPEGRTEGGASAPESGEDRSTAAKMRDGAMARTAQGRDLAARKARALRSTTAGLAAGSAAGATAGRGAPPRGAASSSRPANAPARGGRPAPRRGGPRRVRLTAQRIDPWSVLKISFLVSVALGIAGVVMVALLWTVLSGMNVFSTISDFFTQVTSGETGGPSFDLMDYFGFGRVVSLAAVLGVLNVFLLTALATLTAFLYNICAALVGGTQVTLSDE
ncbi:DUF3566 domain-containing protein [Ornithinimicrobium pekingense]|uniref:DUF3566 domain-containing protein n=1 Tax=Ornithinimicrobium pekingense TaxID=384677 RepID=A0ABQ2FD20_9MICO|nr:DUF3566 domain-containing protein [Ornithinimicrobium pekingense]GGK73804.1 hypothetical protein GCM10011509_23080 [Ornithinimicrobium pekingense]